MAEAKLRPAASNRHANYQQRNSVNYTGSTLQEDLMKLINPDYMSNDDNFNNGGLANAKPQKNTQNSHSLGNISSLSGGLKSIVNVATSDDIFLMRKKSRSREGINLGSHGMPISTSDIKHNNNGTLELKLKKSTPMLSDSTESEVIFTTAQPATVISASSMNAINKANSEDHNDGSSEHRLNEILHIQEENNCNKANSTRKTAANGKSSISNGGSPIKRSKGNELIIPPHSLPLLPDSKDIDWNGLVETTISQIHEGLHQQNIEAGGSNSSASTPSSTLINVNKHRQQIQLFNQNEGHEILSTSSSPTGHVVVTTPHRNASQSSLPDLQNQVTQLEDRISKETRRRKSLEHAVRRLTEENRRLQDESQAAVQQLRRFSEWFFQTIDRET